MNCLIAIYCGTLLNCGVSLQVELQAPLLDVLPRAAEVTKAACTQKNTKVLFAATGMYAVLLQGDDLASDARQELEKQLRDAQSLLGPDRANTKGALQEELRAEIEAALAKFDYLAALDGAGRLATYYSVADLLSIDANALRDAVRGVALYCPACIGSKKEVCPNPDCNKSGGVTRVKACDRCNNGQIACDACGGSRLIKCDVCGGKGVVSETVKRSGRGPLKERETRKVDCNKCGTPRGMLKCRSCIDGIGKCRTCNGKGNVIEKGKCDHCKLGKIDCTMCGGTGARKP